MKKVLVLGLGDTYGGVEQYFVTRLPYLLNQAQIDFAYPVGINVPYKDKLRGTNLVRIPKLSTPFLYYSYLKNIINTEHYDIVDSNQAFANGILYLAVQNSSAKLIVHAHNTRIDIPNNFKRSALVLYHYISRFLFTILVDCKYGCSGKACEWVFGSLKKATIRKNSINAKDYKFNSETRNRVRADLNLQGKIVFGHIGRFSKQKNHDFLIDIFNAAHKKEPRSILLLIGDGELKESIKKKVQELKLSKAVLFLGKRNDVPSLLQAMDCFVLPSLFEGLGIVAIEAQAAGLPCVLSNNVPTEAKVITSTKFIDLRKSKDYWADELISSAQMPRIDAFNLVKESGYDLKTNMEKCVDFFHNQTDGE